MAGAKKECSGDRSIVKCAYTVDAVMYRCLACWQLRRYSRCTRVGGASKIVLLYDVYPVCACL